MFLFISIFFVRLFVCVCVFFKFVWLFVCQRLSEYAIGLWAFFSFEHPEHPENVLKRNATKRKEKMTTSWFTHTNYNLENFWRNDNLDLTSVYTFTFVLRTRKWRMTGQLMYKNEMIYFILLFSRNKSYFLIVENVYFDWKKSIRILEDWRKSERMHF